MNNKEKIKLLLDLLLDNNVINNSLTRFIIDKKNNEVSKILKEGIKKESFSIGLINDIKEKELFNLENQKMVYDKYLINIKDNQIDVIERPKINWIIQNLYEGDFYKDFFISDKIILLGDIETNLFVLKDLLDIIWGHALEIWVYNLAELSTFSLRLQDEEKSKNNRAFKEKYLFLDGIQEKFNKIKTIHLPKNFEFIKDEVAFKKHKLFLEDTCFTDLEVKQGDFLDIFKTPKKGKIDIYLIEGTPSTFSDMISKSGGLEKDYIKGFDIIYNEKIHFISEYFYKTTIYRYFNNWDINGLRRIWNEKGMEKNVDAVVKHIFKNTLFIDKNAKKMWDDYCKNVLEL